MSATYHGERAAGVPIYEMVRAHANPLVARGVVRADFAFLPASRRGPVLALMALALAPQRYSLAGSANGQCVHFGPQSGRGASV